MVFECTLDKGELFKKIVSSLTELVQEGNFIVDPVHISFQGMDSSHVSLCAMSLKSEGFSDYQCDQDFALGLHFESLTKVLKCMSSKDSLTIRHDLETDKVLLIFEDPKESRISNFELKLMDIDSEQLGIPNTEYAASIQMPSVEFQRICRDLVAIGDILEISVTKEGVMFGVKGDIGSGKMCLKGHMSRRKKKKKAVPVENGAGAAEEEKENNSEHATQVKKETDTGMDSVPSSAMDTEMETEPERETMDEDGSDEDSAVVDNVDEDDDDESEWESDPDTGNVDDDEDKRVMIRMGDTITQTFALRYLNNFTKATQLSKTVTLQLAHESPLVCEYGIGENAINGYIRYYLAPKIEDDDEAEGSDEE